MELAHTRQSPALPFVMEVTLFRGEAFTSDQEVDKQLASFARMFPPEHSFVLKLNGGLVEKADIVKLNEKVGAFCCTFLLSCSSPLSLVFSPLLVSSVRWLSSDSSRGGFADPGLAALPAPGRSVVRASHGPCSGGEQLPAARACVPLGAVLPHARRGGPVH